METIMFLDYETMRVIWWLLMGALLIGFAIMDGFDLGVVALLGWVGRSDIERRIVINSVGPVWEGNQVWLILGAGVIFAAFPPLYASVFSGFYIAMFLLLVCLILRPVGFKYRSKIVHPAWRTTWDWLQIVSGVVIPIVFGVAVGNVMLGVPFHFDDSMRSFYEGGFFGLLTPFPLLCGIVGLSMLLMHGGIYLALKTEHELQKRAKQAVKLSAIVLLASFTAAGIWVAVGVDGYVILSGIDPNAINNPLHKNVIRDTGAWLNNYHDYPWTILIPIVAYAAIFKAFVLVRMQRYLWAWIASAFAIAGVISTFGFSVFPFLLPSSNDPRSSLTIWDASSSHMTLFVMMLATALFLPIIIAYTAWVYHVLRGKVTAQQIADDESSY